MPAQLDMRLAIVLLGTAVLAAVLTWVSILYARRRQLIDQPGQRRSHTVPTPRGGGIAIVIAVLAGGASLVVDAEGWVLFAFIAPPILGIALVGWVDDHGGLSARTRFAMHCLAALWLFAGVLLPAWAWFFQADAAMRATLLLVVAASLVAIVWSINLHNFMDGIDGLLTTQALFVFAASAMLLAGYGMSAAVAPLLVCAAACVGFLPFNFPHARVFMGDVGSGVLGFLVALAVLCTLDLPAPTSGLVLCSAFVADATCTLLSRVLRGRRWYSAHREHLYQWLVRCDRSHARVVVLYMGWNLLVVLPVVVWMNLSASSRNPSPMNGFVATAAIYAAAFAAWWYGKRRCLVRVRERRIHAAA